VGRDQGRNRYGRIRALGQRGAEALGLLFSAEVLSRAEPKRWHGPHSRLRQAPDVAALPDPAPPLVSIVDDLCTVGQTMRNSIVVIRTSGVVAFGFAASGCGRTVFTEGNGGKSDECRS
jgi:hypothetical protein